MSPEQADGETQVDARIDVYAMGVILYNMLSGRLPFEADSIPSLLYKIVNKPAPSLAEVLPGIPPPIDEVITRAMSKRPDSRYASIDLFWQSFADALDRSGIALPTPADSGQRRLPSSRNTMPQLGPSPDSGSLSDPELTLPPDTSRDSVLPPRRLPPRDRIALIGALLVAFGGAGWLALRQVDEGTPQQPSGATSRPLGSASRAADLATAAVAATPDAPVAATPHAAVAATPDAAVAATPDAAIVAHPDADGPSRVDLAPGRAASRPQQPRPIRRASRGAKTRGRPRRVRSTEPATISLTTPWQGESLPATIYLDGQKVGESPLYRKIAPGVYSISARKRGFREVSTTVRLKPGAAAKIVLPLQR
jgi:serine/threonine-protein kinase